MKKAPVGGTVLVVRYVLLLSLLFLEGSEQFKIVRQVEENKRSKVS